MTVTLHRYIVRTVDRPTRFLESDDHISDDADDAKLYYSAEWAEGVRMELDEPEKFEVCEAVITISDL